MSEDKTGTIAELVGKWELIAASRLQSASSPTDDAERKDWLRGYAAALDAAAQELTEALAAQPTDALSAALRALRRDMRSARDAAGEAHDAIDRALVHLAGGGVLTLPSEPPRESP